MTDWGAGTGRTTEQIRSAPLGALFIWPYFGTRWYAEEIMRKLGRTDLTVTSLSHAKEALRGRRWSGVIFDHACEATSELSEMAARAVR